MKNYWKDRSKAFKAFVSSFTQDSELFDKAIMDKKIKQQKNKWDSTNLANGVNIAEIGDKKKKKKDVIKIIC